MLHRGRQLGHVVHEAAVAVQRQHRHVGVGDLGAERGGVTAAQRALVAAGHHGARPVDRQADPGHIAHLGQLIDHDTVVRQRLADHLEKGHLRRQLGLELGLHRPLQVDQFLLARVPPAVAVGHRRHQLAQRLAGIGDDTNRRPAHAVDLGRIDIEPDQLLAVGQPPRHALVLQSGAERQDNVGRRPQPCAGHLGLAEIVPVADQTAAGAMGYHGRLQHLGQHQQLRLGADRAAADEYHRRSGVAQQVGRRVDQFGIGAKRRVGFDRRQQLDLRLACHHVHRHLQLDRPNAAASELLEGLGHGIGCQARMLDPGRPFGQAGDQIELVGDLVQQTEAAADIVGRNLAGERQHRRVAAIGGGERRRRVQQAGAGHHGVDADPAAGGGIAECHIAGTLLVAGMDHPDRVALVVQRVEQVVELHAGQAEDGVDAVAQDRFDQCLAAGHARHRGCPLVGLEPLSPVAADYSAASARAGLSGTWVKVLEMICQRPSSFNMLRWSV